MGISVEDALFNLQLPAFSEPAIVAAILVVLFASYAFLFTEGDIVDAESYGLYVVSLADVPDKTAHSVGAGNTESGLDMQPETLETMEITVRKCAESVAEHYGLTQREIDVTTYLALGYSRKRICEELFLSEGTVNTHITHVYQKLGIHKRSEVLQAIAENTE